MKKKWLLVMTMAGILTLTAACGNKEKSPETESATGTASETEGLITLGNYKNVEIDAIVTAVSDEDMEGMIQDLRLSYPERVEVKDRTVVENGDVVTIDYIGRKDGVAFEGGTAEGYDLVIGSGQFIDGFEEGLIGRELGETCELNLTFPETYPSEELAGQDVVFEVTIHKISLDVLPDWTDEFVQTYTDYDSIDAYVEGTRADWEAYNEEMAPSWKIQSVVENIIANSEFDCEEEVEAQYTSMLAQYEAEAAAYGFDLETYLYYVYGLTMSQVESELDALANYQVKGQLAMKEIIRLENMTLTDEEYTEGLELLAAENGAESPEAFEEQYGKEVIEESVLYEKVMNWLADQAVEL